jgi:hypothetical protein
MNGRLLDRVVKNRDQFTRPDLALARRLAHPDRKVEEHAVALNGQLNHRLPPERRARGGLLRPAFLIVMRSVPIP